MVKSGQIWTKLTKLIYTQKHRKSEDFRCFVSEIVGNTGKISAWRTEEHDVQPSDRTRPELKAISVAAQQLFMFWIGDDRSINTNNQVFFGVKHAFHPSKLCVFN